jgi:large subunit ribosomal protein L22
MEATTKTKKKKSVLIREKKEAEKDFKALNAGNLGSARAYLKDVPTSPRKMRLVADLVRGKDVFHALNLLKFEPKIGATYITNALKSAIANWKQKNANVDLDDANLFISEIFVDCGKMLKRLRPAPQGRGHRIRKRSNHITLVVDSKPAETIQS